MTPKGILQPFQRSLRINAITALPYTNENAARVFMEAVIIALWNIVANPLRSFLTTIGIVVGIAAVIVVIAIGEGNREVIQSKIKMMGANLIAITLQNSEFDDGKILAGMPTFVDLKAIATLKIKFQLLKLSPLFYA